MPLNDNTVKIANLSPGDCIPLNFTVAVAYTNANNVNGKVSVECGGANAPLEQAAPGAAGTLTFAISHAAAAANHTVTAELKHDGVRVAGDGVPSVGIGNPCPIVIGGGTGVFQGLITLDPTKPLGGTFAANVGNRVVVHVLQPTTVNGVLRESLIIFADPAVVDAQGAQGKWKHDVIPDAANGQHVRVFLTKDGKVKAVAHAIFKN